MATSDWAIPTGKEITGTTYIKDTDNYLAATIEDLVDWCNNASGTYNDWTLTGLRTDFLDINTAQTITGVKTVDTLGAIDFTGGELRIGSTAVTSTAAELNILDGVTATTAELNILDGVTATTAELNILDGVTSTAAELNVLDGISPTLTALELNILDGVTATTSELNIMDGVTATTAEINILDGVTATATEINYVDGVTSNIQTQLDTKASITYSDSNDIGVGQTWTDVKASRSTGVTYTNTTGKPIEVAISITATASNGSASISVGGVPLGIISRWPTAGGGASFGSVIVPSGATYIVTASGATINTWVELR